MIKYIIKNNQKGSVLFLVILLVSGLTALGLGLATILIGELELSRDTSNFIPAIYGADIGAEMGLYIVRQGPTSTYDFSVCPDKTACTIPLITLTTGQEFRVVVLDPGVDWCPATAFKCLRSIGSYADTNRAFEIIF